jgi:hypothetical protein
MAVAQIGIGPVEQLELPAGLCGSHVDARRLQPPAVFRTEVGIDDVKGLLAALEAVFHVGEEHAILLIRAVKEGANMTSRIKDGARETNGLFLNLRHVVFLFVPVPPRAF